ncbi:hypothetical protein [Citrobacter werkmanii]|uniref:hypothetical protein n=1 Tax=Citrobacter werkmanii TaxID=67827 RepID=UPI000A102B21|nr:hypothetical protein [Citrobacter werkmanii]EDA8384618.1 hypothetical protein [Salmonella enterica subsp. enterica serovar Corvallis]ORT73424.1 hypothetical protein BO998_16370 [Citrobacter werkmanii]OSP13229.1 hypothetical protein B6S66_25020 [Citrobacter werkmanii]
MKTLNKQALSSHPAHGPVSLDRLHQISEILSKAAAQSDGGNLGYAMADAVKVIDGAITAFGAEPVAEIKISRGGYDKGEKIIDYYSEEIQHLTDGQKLYTSPPAPPAPVVPAEKTDSDYVTDCHGVPSLDDCAHQRGWNECRTAMLQAGNSPVTPDGLALVPKRLTAENGAKGVLSGEFSETKFINCPECFGDDECETCDGSGRIEITVPVSWTNIKAIWAKGVEHFEAAPQQENI